MPTSYPPEPLRQYAVLADGERAALIGPRGDIAFMCFPAWQDDTVFGALIGAGGHYAVTPTDERFVWGGHYEPGRLVWRSRWVTTSTIIECREAMLYPGESGRAVILRQIRAVRGDAHVSVSLDPRPGFGTASASWRRTSDTCWGASAGNMTLRWTGVPGNAWLGQSGVSAALALTSGERHDLVLEIGIGQLPRTPPDPTRAWEATIDAWDAHDDLARPALALSDVQHSRLVLRGLTSESGGMVAAATMGLPERAEQGRNYDYRYAWIRDQCLAGLAGAAAQDWFLLDRASAFVAERLLADGPDLKPAYTVAGGRVPPERTLDISGYPGGQAAVGNHVLDQFQLDSVGESLLLLAVSAEVGRETADHRKAAEVAIGVIADTWQRPEAGIWELENRHWTHSRLMCAAGLKAWGRSPPGRSSRVDELASRLYAEVDRTSIHPSGRWQRAPDDARVDAALLIPIVRGAVAPDDPRGLATVRAVQDELAEDGFVYRYRHSPRPLNDAEGAFVLCGFHMAMATAAQNDALAAIRWFERNRSAMGPPGLFSEEYDVVQRQLRGNVPQAFAHALFVEAAVRLAEAVPHS